MNLSLEADAHTALLADRAALDRAHFISALGGQVEWISVGDEKGPLLMGSRVRYLSQPPSTQAVGVHPKGRLVILDFDIKAKGISPETQMLSLEGVGFDFTQALKVRTPSGGLHVYITWAEHAPLPRNIKLEKLGHRFSPPLELEGDVRGSQKTGHAVAPGSILKGKLYSLEDGGRLAPTQSLDLCSFIASEAAGVKLSPGALEPEAEVEEELENGDEDLLPRPSGEERATPEVLAAAQRLVNRSKKSYWHELRAEVFRELHCCYGGPQMVFLWQQLNIARDTHRNQALGVGPLYRDYARLCKRYPPTATHGRCCPKTLLMRKEARQKAKREQAPELAPTPTQALEKVKKPSSWRTPSVISLRQASLALKKGRYPSKHYEKAMMVVEDVLQPWANHGVTNIVLGNDFLAKTFGWTPGEVRAVKALLLAKGVVYVARSPAPGVTTAFAIPPTMKNHVLGRLLYASAKDFAQDLFLDVRRGGFYSPATGEVVVKLRKQTLALLVPPEGLPERVGAEPQAVLTSVRGRGGK